jgi:hypothetical protein
MKINFFDPYLKDREANALAHAKEIKLLTSIGRAAAFRPQAVTRKQAVHQSQTRRQKTRPPTLPNIWK